MRGRGFGVWAPKGVLGVEGGWMHCPISGEQIRGSRVRMRQYAKDMNYLGFHVRPKGKATIGFVCRKLTTEGVSS